MAKVLLVDTNFSSGPLHSELLAMGHDVHVVGNNPTDCLAKISNSYWQVDYSDIQALSDLVARNRFDYLVPGCTDQSYASCVAINEGRYPGFDSRDAWHAVHDKGAIRLAARRLAIPVPAPIDATSAVHSTSVIVKPVDAFSGKGTTVVQLHDRAALSLAIATAKDASPSGEYLTEAFVEGQLYSHSAFIRQGTIQHDFLVREDATTNPFVVDTSHVIPSADSELLAALRNAIESLAGDLRLTDGLLHTQFIANGKSFWLIELTRRCPGDLYSQLIELSTGYPYARAYLLPFLGGNMPPQLHEMPCLPIMRHTVTLSEARDLAYIHFNRPLQIERWTPLALVGDHISPSPLSRIGILFCLATDQEELALIYNQTLARDLYAIRD